MEYNKEKKTSVKVEQAFDILCLAASYGILFLLPQTVGFFFYLFFGGAAFTWPAVPICFSLTPKMRRNMW